VLDTDERAETSEPINDTRRGRLARVRGTRALAAWDYLPFRRYLGVQMLAMAGRALQSTLVGYLVYDLSESNLLLGVVSFMQMVPQLLLAPVVGVIVDRFDRRRILAAQFGIQAVGFLVLALLAVTDLLTVPAIAATVVVMGIANAFSYPAHSSLLPNLVPLGTLQSANAINSMMANLSRVAAPTLSGVIVDGAGVAAALLLASGIYWPAAVLVLLVPLLLAGDGTTLARGPLEPAARPSFRRDIGDAVGYIRTNPLLRSALANDIAPYLFGMAHMALLPAVASDTLDGGATMLGLLYAVSGVGAMFGTLAAGALTGRELRGRTIWVATIGFGAGLLIIATGESAAIIMPGLFVTGFFQMLYIIQNDTLVQTFAEDRFRGRALAAQSMVNGLMPIGFLLLGAIAELTSLQLAFAIAGAALVISGITTRLFRRVMWELR
jgi:MFS family permease